MSEPRAMTPEEMRAEFFDHIASIFKYWRDVDLSTKPASPSEIQYRMEGFLFSMLVMFDGGSACGPGFEIRPDPHPDDQDYCRMQFENWWVNQVINDTQMHEVFPWEKVH